MNLRDSVRSIAEEAICRHNCRLYDVYSHRDRFQIFIDRPSKTVCESDHSVEESQSVNLEDCEKVSRSLSFLLQSEIPDFFKKWRLEVSSPGLEKKLREKWHFKESLGQDVRITAFSHGRAVNIQTKREWKISSFSGTLISFEEDILKLRKDSVYWEVSYKQIKQARLVFVLMEPDNQVKKSRHGKITYKKIKAKKLKKRRN